MTDRLARSPIRGYLSGRLGRRILLTTRHLSKTSAPAIGICQAAMQAASVVSGSFTIAPAPGRSVAGLEHLVWRYRYDGLCRRVGASEIPVIDLEDPASDARDRLGSEVRRALGEDGAETAVLGCAGMDRSTSDEFGVPVLKGVTAAVKLVEGLAALGVTTSRRGGYASPRPNACMGTFSHYAPRIETGEASKS